MKLPPNHPAFRAGLDGKFLSPFPSEETEFEAKFAELKELTTGGQEFGELIYSGALTKSMITATQMLAFESATNIGDLRTDWLPNIAWPKIEGGAETWQGLFSGFSIPNSNSVEEIVSSLASTGLTVASNFVSAVPIIGWIIGAGIKLGGMMYRMLKSDTLSPQKKMERLPWQEYSRARDEDFIELFAKPLMKSVDLTAIWAPPFEAREWRLLPAERGLALIPANDNDKPAYGSGLGCMPGTQRVMDRIQIRNTKIEDRDGGRNGYWWTRDGQIAVMRVAITDCGLFYPSLANVGASLWSGVNRVGSPDMYKVDTKTLLTRWSDVFGILFERVFSRIKSGNAGPILGYAVSPFIVQDGEVGIKDLDRSVPKDRHFVWEGLFEQRGPVPPEQRIHPYGSGEVNCPIWANEYPGYYGKNNCYPWPVPRELLRTYAPVHTEIILPAIERLRTAQRRSLGHSLVCAYVRPQAVQGKPRYAAFSDKSLRDYCIACRKELLKRRARFRVHLKDVEEIDPEFANALRDSGVTNKFGDYSASLDIVQRPGGSLPDPSDEPGRNPLIKSDPVPDARPPQGGIGVPGALSLPSRAAIADVARAVAPWLVVAAAGQAIFRGR